jgi:alpha-mannosidase
MAKSDSLRVGRIVRVLNQFVRPARRGPSVPLEVAAFHVHGEPVPYDEAVKAPYEPFAVGGAWGPAWDTTWFRLRGRIPVEWAGGEVRIGFAIGNAGETGFGAEALLYRDDVPVQGFSPNHRHHRLTGSAAGGEEIECFVEAAANPPSPFGANPWPLLMADPHGHPQFTLAKADLHVVDPALEAFFHDFRVAVELMFELPEADPRRARLLAGLERAVDRIDLPEIGGSWREASPVVHALLEERASPSAHRVSAVGHAHLDTAWLWPLRETVRKAARTFATVCDLMDHYPEYRFVISQAQHLAWMRDHYPALFERIRARVTEGRIEPTGSMWVEADCNIPSGESLVRQIVFGKRFFLDEFGVETEDVWLPDVFGYSAALPQIMRLGGARRFLTQKLSWNQYNDMPHHTFLWEGIDGSRVLTHFPPADTYGGQVSAHELRYGAANFRDHEHVNRSLYLFGYGDGGGGPTDAMLESARRLGDSEGLPRLTMEGPRAFFDKVEEELVEPAVWSGELYLEHHRGTYTSQAETKWGNRRGELALRDAEAWSALSGATEPDARLDHAWRTLLVNQFHDIIPGSGIHWVYEDTRAELAAVRRTAEEVADTSLRRLTESVDTTGLSHPVVVWNSLSRERCDLAEVEVPDGATVARDPDGVAVPLQAVGDGRAVFEATVPAFGYRTYDLVAGDADSGPAPAEAGPRHLTNGILRVELDDLGLFRSIVDQRVGRQVLVPEGGGNLLQLHPDYPNFFDAWDIDAWYRRRAEDLVAVDNIEVLESGPVRSAIRLKRSFGSSSITQTVSLAAGSPVIRVDNEIDWQERNRLLKVAFPVAVRSPRATYEIQYGHVERPTHANTSWEAARFEVCAHKWADWSEPGYGVALLNDCKYGYDITERGIRLSLLRSPTWPDPEADRGVHRFAYGLLPHPGDLRTAGVVDAGYEFNVPLRVRPTTAHAGTRAAAGSLVGIDAANACVEVVKRADDGSGALIVRLYEAWGARGPVTVTAPAPLRRATRTALLERELGPVEVVAGAARVDLRPFEIVTLRLEGA